MNETKVNTNNSDFTTSEAKNNIFAKDHVGVIETPYGTQLVNKGDAIDHAVMRARQLSSLLLLMQGDNSESFCGLGPGHRDSLLWLAAQMAEESLAMVEIVAADAAGGQQ